MEMSNGEVKSWSALLVGLTRSCHYFRKFLIAHALHSQYSMKCRHKNSWRLIHLMNLKGTKKFYFQWLVCSRIISKTQWIHECQDSPCKNWPCKYCFFFFPVKSVSFWKSQILPLISSRQLYWIIMYCHSIGQRHRTSHHSRFQASSPYHTFCWRTSKVCCF